MIKVRIHLDGNEQGYLTYTCKESMKEYIDFITNSNPRVLGLTEIDSNAFITIPWKRYVVEAWELNE